MQQHPCYGAACRALGAEVLNLSFGRGTAPLATAQVVLRRWPLLGRFALVTRGPVWSEQFPPADRHTALHALVDQLAQRFTGVILTPDRDQGRDLLEGRGLLRMMSPFHLAEIDLTGPHSARRAALDQKWRNRLNRAEASGLQVKITRLPADPQHWLLRAEAAQSRQRRYSRLPPSFSVAWETATPGGTRLFSLYQAGRPIAGILVLLHAPTATYHIGWTGPEGRHVSAHNLLMWQAGCWLAERGYTGFDLGVLDTETTPGLARFKLGAGAKPVHLSSTWMRAPGTAMVARLGAAWSQHWGAVSPGPNGWPGRMS
ncbi:GNAT family N-acetyltransferase [Pseudoruegeria sp. SK021]|uniref:GNAT family N-acetyltransferase n=1 Tax=Pseudoruegeria sp. SK021 TaxID=1933035 RepID=UPI000A3271A6|nr:GNAT family N-acetyltransferase [Pseudoruegeria sp. SK021]